VASRVDPREGGRLVKAPPDYGPGNGTGPVRVNASEPASTDYALAEPIDPEAIALLRASLRALAHCYLQSRERSTRESALAVLAELDAREATR